MQDESQNTSITILLVICIAILASIGIGWFVLDGSDADQPAPVAALPEASPPAEVAVAKESKAEAPSPAVAIDADLRKARMAAEAEILTSPAQQSALYFYGRVLKADPRHEVANAELDAVLGKLAVAASGNLAAGDFAAAYGLAQQVAAVRPDHALVNEVQQMLDRLSGEYVTQAMAFAEAGNSESAQSTLARAESLPGRNRNYFRAVRESIDDLLQVQQAAQQEQVESARLAEVRATGEWMEKVRVAIADGRLLSPDGDCAFRYVNERDATDEITVQVRQELFAAMLGNASSDIDGGNLDDADRLLLAANELQPESEDIAQVRLNLEDAYVIRESSKVLPIAELKRLTTVPAKYPRRAEERGISGWVEVQFTVLPTGRTTDVTVASAEPERIFDNPAVEAVEQWTFEPRQFRGQIIAQRATAKLVFKLQ